MGVYGRGRTSKCPGCPARPAGGARVPSDSSVCCLASLPCAWVLHPCLAFLAVSCLCESRLSISPPADWPVQSSPGLETLQAKLEEEKKKCPYQLCVVEQTLVSPRGAESRNPASPQPGRERPGDCLLATAAETQGPGPGALQVQGCFS